MATGLPTAPQSPTGKTIGDTTSTAKTGKRTEKAKVDPFEALYKKNWTEFFKKKYVQALVSNVKIDAETGKKALGEQKKSALVFAKMSKIQWEQLSMAKKAAELARQGTLAMKAQTKQLVKNKLDGISPWKILLAGILAIVLGVYLLWKTLSGKLGKWFGTMKLLIKSLFKIGETLIKNAIPKLLGIFSGLGKTLMKFFEKIAQRLFIFFARTLPNILIKIGEGALKGGPFKKIIGVVAKAAGKFMKLAAKILKKLPIIGTLIGIGFAIKRFINGDFIGGMLDLASAIVAIVPGVGTFLSIAIDLFSAWRDSTKDEKGKASPIADLAGTMLAKFIKFLKPILKKIPIIGLLIGIGFGIKRFMDKDIIGGILEIASGLFSLIPGPGTFASLAIDLLLGARDAAGTDSTTGKTIGNVAKVGIKMMAKFIKFLKPGLKKIPIIGLLVGIGFAVQRFMNGDILAGILEIASGIASILPGPGTAISFGIDLLLAVYDAKGGKEKTGGIGNMIASFGKWLYPKLKFIPIIGNLILIGEGIYDLVKGNIPVGLVKLIGSILTIVPGLGQLLTPALNWLIGKTEEKVEADKAAGKKTSMKGIMKIMKDLVVEKVKQMFGFMMKLGDAFLMIFSGSPKVGFYNLFKLLSGLPLIGKPFGWIAGWIGEPTKEENQIAQIKKTNLVEKIKAFLIPLLKKALSFFIKLGDALLYIFSGNFKVGLWTFFNTLSSLPIIGGAFGWIAGWIGEPTIKEKAVAQKKKISFVSKIKKVFTSMIKEAFSFFVKIGDALGVLFAGDIKKGTFMMFSTLSSLPIVGKVFGMVAGLFNSPSKKDKVEKPKKKTGFFESIKKGLINFFKSLMEKTFGNLLRIGEAVRLIFSGKFIKGLAIMFRAIGSLLIPLGGIGLALITIGNLMDKPMLAEKTAQAGASIGSFISEMEKKIGDLIYSLPVVGWRIKVFQEAHNKGGFIFGIGELLKTLPLPTFLLNIVEMLFGKEDPTTGTVQPGKLAEIKNMFVDAITGFFKKIVGMITGVFDDMMSGLDNLIDKIPGASLLFGTKEDRQKKRDKEKAEREEKDRVTPKADMMLDPGGRSKTIHVQDALIKTDPRDKILAGPFGSMFGPQKYKGLTTESKEMAKEIYQPIVDKLDEILRATQPRGSGNTQSKPSFKPSTINVPNEKSTVFGGSRSIPVS